MENPDSVIVIPKSKIRYYLHYILAILIFTCGLSSLIFPAASCKGEEYARYIFTWGKSSRAFLLFNYIPRFYNWYYYSVILLLFGILTGIFAIFWALRWKSLTKNFSMKTIFAICFLIYTILVIFQIRSEFGWGCYIVSFGLISLFLEVLLMALDIAIERIPSLQYNENQ